MMLRVVLLFMLCSTAISYEDAQMTVLANHMVLYKGVSNNTIEYRYQDGDMVEFTCFAYYGRVSIRYYYAGAGSPKNQLTSSHEPVQLRTSLQSKHNNSQVTCERFEWGSETTQYVTVTFILENVFNDLFNLKINGLALRPQKVKYFSKYVVCYGEESMRSETKIMTFECEKSNDEVFIQSYQYQYDTQQHIQRYFRSTDSYRIVSDYENPLRYEARNTTTKSPLRIVEFRFEYIRALSSTKQISSDDDHAATNGSQNTDVAESTTEVETRDLNTFHGHVSGSVDNIIVLVNRAQLYKGNKDSSTMYRYVDGDTVDVVCMSSKSEGSMTLNYFFGELFEGTTDSISINDDGGPAAAGVRHTLREAHNHSTVTCKYIYNTIEVVVNITFILEDSIDDVMNLKINGLSLRPQNNRDSSEYIIYDVSADMHHWNGNNLSFEYNSSDDVVVEYYQYECNTHNKTLFVPRITTITAGVRHIPDFLKYLRYEARDRKTMLLVHTTDIRFESVPFRERQLNEVKDITLTPADHNNIEECNQDKEYYDYYDEYTNIM